MPAIGSGAVRLASLRPPGLTGFQDGFSFRKRASSLSIERDVHALALLAGAGFLAGVMNAVAGGGSFVTFPALVAAGLPSVGANASSTVALFPGQVTTAYAYRKQLRDFEGLSMRMLIPLSLAGGICGALLLLLTPQSTFDRVIPWLLLAGTIAFAFGPRLGLLQRGDHRR